jgi:hypothetical protein
MMQIPRYRQPLVSFIERTVIVENPQDFFVVRFALSGELLDKFRVVHLSCIHGDGTQVAAVN